MDLRDLHYYGGLLLAALGSGALTFAALGAPAGGLGAGLLVAGGGLIYAEMRLRRAR